MTEFFHFCAKRKTRITLRGMASQTLGLIVRDSHFIVRPCGGMARFALNTKKVLGCLVNIISAWFLVAYCMARQALWVDLVEIPFTVP